MSADAASIRRFASLALVAGLCFAAASAVLALLTGSFGDTDVRVILSSIGFAVFSATGSAGAAGRLRPSERLQKLGGATLLASAVAFLLLLIGLWSSPHDWGSEDLWRWFGCVGVLAIAGSHACVMLGARRRHDSDAIRVLTLSSLGLGAFDALALILPLAEIVDGIDEPWPNIFGASLVLLVLTTILPPILRRAQPVAQPAPGSNGNARTDDEFLASALIRIADRIDVLNSDPGNRAPDIQREVNRLRNLAQSVES